MTDDTAAILAAIEKFIEGPHDMLTTDPGHCSACREYHDAKLALSSLRSHIEKESAFVEAAKEVAELWAHHHVDGSKLVKTWRALTETPEMEKR